MKIERMITGLLAGWTLILSALLLSAEASADCFNNPRYGNCYGNDRNSIKIYSQDGRFMGNLNDNQFDPNSVSNRYGRYGSPYSPESIHNPYRPKHYGSPGYSW